MTDTAREARRDRLLGMLSSSWLAQGLYVLAKLGIPDLMAEGPRSAAELAQRSGAHPIALRRLLAGLASAGLLRETEPRTYALTPISDFLRSEAPDSARETAILYGEVILNSFADILHTIRTGEPAFTHVYGQPFYDYLEQHPDAAHTFNEAQGAQPVPETLFECAIPEAGTVVDVGGGKGRLLAALVERLPRARGVLFDLPNAALEARKLLGAEPATAERVEVVEGSFFDSVPPGGDVYVLARVLHNWTDEHALEALQAIRASMPATARLVVLERFLATDEVRARSASAARANMADLLMLAVLEGHDRTEPEYRELLQKSGFRVVASHPPSGSSVESALEAVPE